MTGKVRPLGMKKSLVFVTGDMHRNFWRFSKFVNQFETTKDDIMIILGDVGINFNQDASDIKIKEHLQKLPLTFFCIQGNHELRPEHVEGYELKEWHGGLVYVQPDYPSLLFAKDGEIYDIAGEKTLVIGGAYSVDKYYRLITGRKWFSDEQPSEETKALVEGRLAERNWQVDVILSHTVPYSCRPVDHFLPGLDPDNVDSSTEIWLDQIMRKTTYEKWYAGHFHCDRIIGHLEIMYGKVWIFCSDTDLGFNFV